MKGYWCYKVLPLVYDGSLSYYEVLCRIVKYINGLIDDMKASGEQIKEMREEIEVIEREIQGLYNETFSLEASVESIGQQCNTVEEGLRSVGVALTGIFSRVDAVENSVINLSGEVGVNTLAIGVLQGKVPFAFGVDENGNYGYYKEGADTVTPFKSGDNRIVYIDSDTVWEYFEFSITINSETIVEVS